MKGYEEVMRIIYGISTMNMVFVVGSYSHYTEKISSFGVCERTTILRNLNNVLKLGDGFYFHMGETLGVPVLFVRKVCICNSYRHNAG